MSLKHFMTVAPLLALFAAGNISTVLHSPPGWRPQMQMNAPLPVAGTIEAKDRTSPQLLAEGRKPDSSGERSAPTSRQAPAARAPAPAEDADDRNMPQRASPEASNDLFQLLKQADPKKGKPK
jgi:hypothetical protein